MYEDIKGDIFADGFQVVPARVLFSEELKPLDKLIYIAILNFSVKGKAQISLPEIGGIVGVDRKAVARHIETLEDAGLIIKKSIKNKTRTGRYNEYYIQNEVK